MKKTLYIVGGFFGFLLIVQIVAGNFDFGSLFQGQILGNEDSEINLEDPSSPGNLNNSENTPTDPADLTANLNFSFSENDELVAEIEITNLGPGDYQAQEGGYQYALYLNDQQIISARDQATTLDADDSFSFSYPISSLIYEYPESGQLSFEVDTENEITESDEANNVVEIDYQR